MNVVPSSRWRVIVIVALACASSAFGQGSLTPPGPPGPIMKSLDQLEPRTPISSVPFTIDRSGSYYLTRGVVATGGDGITVNVSSVTIDLNGFTIISSASPAAGAAIVVNGSSITILNGHIVGAIGFVNNSFVNGAGFLDGIIDPNGVANNVLVRDVTVSGCNNGIRVSSASVEHCSARSIAQYGISGTSISDSIAETCGTAGLYAGTVQNSRGLAVLGGNGISGGMVLNCNGQANNGNGIDAGDVVNSNGYSSGSGTGIHGQMVSNCSGVSGSGTGLLAYIASFCSGSSNGAGTGLKATTAVGCLGSAAGGGTPVNVTNKYLMP